MPLTNIAVHETKKTLNWARYAPEANPTGVQRRHADMGKKVAIKAKKDGTRHLGTRTRAPALSLPSAIQLSAQLFGEGVPTTILPDRFRTCQAPGSLTEITAKLYNLYIPTESRFRSSIGSEWADHRSLGQQENKRTDSSGEVPSVHGLFFCNERD
jgi:hypothetical protein